jgi:hypothetical protein
LVDRYLTSRSFPPTSSPAITRGFFCGPVCAAGRHSLGLQRPDCVAGHARFELRNVVANYPFESLRGFPRSEPNPGHADHSRLSCSAGDTQLGAGFCRDLSASGRDDVCTWCRPTGETLITLSPPRRRRIVARIFSCSSVGLLCPSTKARVPAVSPFPRAELHDYDVLADGKIAGRIFNAGV